MQELPAMRAGRGRGEGGSGAGATSVQRLPASALWVLSRRNEKVPPPAGTGTGNFVHRLSVKRTDCHTSDYESLVRNDMVIWWREKEGERVAPQQDM